MEWLEVARCVVLIGMRILRGGANRDSGLTILADANDERFGVDRYENTFFSSDPMSIGLFIGNVTSYEKRGQYDFYVELSPVDIARALQELARQGLEKAPDEIAAALEPIKVDLLRLLLCIEGYQSQPRKSSEDD